MLKNFVYLNLCYPPIFGNLSTCLFQTWSVGRVVDSIADRLSLKNENNLANSKVGT